MKKKVISLVVAMLMCFGGLNALANEPNTQKDVSISPNFIAIVTCINNLKLNSGGMLTCEAETLVNSEYNAGVTMELQQYNNGSWKTIKTWSGSSREYIYFGYNWYVVSGYSYRLQLTHTVLSGSTIIESVVKYSKTVTY